MPQIEKSTIQFLKKLHKNNNRPWFQENKPVYEESLENARAFADVLLAEMNKHDHIETPSGKKSLFRIYRDVRFSKDKSPYKNHFSGRFKRATARLRGGYYYHLEPGQVFIACGFFSPEASDLRRIRDEIAMDDRPLRKILKRKALAENWGDFKGDTLKTAPKGFEKDHPAIDLLRYKQFYFVKNYTDKEMMSSDFLKDVNKSFKSIRPFFDYMSEVLTTNLNGESIL